MTAKELAIEMNGRDTGEEMEWGEVQDAKAAGLVAVYGYSDDNVELCGAINDEVGAYNGTTVYLTPDDILQESECGRDDCPHFAREREKARTVKAVWHDKGGPCWTFETDIPHETFTIMEDGEPWCIGIVFSMADVNGKEVQSDA